MTSPRLVKSAGSDVGSGQRDCRRRSNIKREQSDITEENYMRVIYSKTARLFEAAARALRYSRRLYALSKRERVAGLWPLPGTAFQLIDDLLITKCLTAKASGKMWVMTFTEANLPYRCHAMRHGTPEQSAMIRVPAEQA